MLRVVNRRTLHRRLRNPTHSSWLRFDSTTALQNNTQSAPSVSSRKNVSRLSLWRTRFTSFAVGVALTAVVGYSRIQQQVWQAANGVISEVDSLKGSVSTLVNAHQVTETRIAQLQSQLEILLPNSNDNAKISSDESSTKS